MIVKFLDYYGKREEIHCTVLNCIPRIGDAVEFPNPELPLYDVRWVKWDLGACTVYVYVSVLPT